MKNLNARLSKLEDEYQPSTRKRAGAILAAITKGDGDAVRALLKSEGGRFVWSLDIAPTLRAAEAVALVFDKTAYRIMFHWAACGMVATSDKKAKAANKQAEAYEAELSALIEAASIFAERIGFKAGEVFATSEAMTDKHLLTFAVPSDELGPEAKLQTEAFARGFRAIWEDHVSGSEDGRP